MKRVPGHIRNLAYAFLLISLVLSLPASVNLRIMSYNIKDFWLRFDGESGGITCEDGALNERDLERLAIIAGIINEKKPDVIGILESASLAELLFFNERFLEGQCKCWSFRAYDSRTFGVPLGLMVKKNLEIKSIELVEPISFSSRGIIIDDISKGNYEFTLILVHLKSKIEDKLGESALKRDKQGGVNGDRSIRLANKWGMSEYRSALRAFLVRI